MEFRSPSTRTRGRNSWCPSGGGGSGGRWGRLAPPEEERTDLAGTIIPSLSFLNIITPNKSQPFNSVCSTDSGWLNGRQRKQVLRSLWPHLHQLIDKQEAARLVNTHMPDPNCSWKWCCAWWVILCRKVEAIASCPFVASRPCSTKYTSNY